MPFLGLHRAKVLPEVPSLFHVEISTLIKTEVPIIIFDASLVCILEDPASQGRAFVPGLGGDPKGLVDQGTPRTDVLGDWVVGANAEADAKRLAVGRGVFWCACQVSYEKTIKEGPLKVR